MTNIAELLKDATDGMKLYSPLFGELELKCANLNVGGYPIAVIAKNGDSLLFDKYGRYFNGDRFPDAECLLFPSKEVRTWEGWKAPVEPKFKVGNWIACNADSFTLSIKSVRDENYYFHQGASLPIKDIDEHYHLWTIADAKDGDVIAFNDSPDVNFPLRWIGIYKQPRVVSNKSYWFHCIITPDHTFRGYDSWWVSNVHPATKEQRDLLFEKMKEAGYEWDADKKELKKIQPHYDIKNFHAGMPVLVRDDNDQEWNYLYFSHYSKKLPDNFFAGGNPWEQCIPFEGNEHLLGTTDMPSEEYINW